MTFLAGDELPASDLNDFAPGGDISLTSGGEIIWNADTNLYRGAASQLKTDDAFRAASFTENSGAATVSVTQTTAGTTTSTSYTATLTGGTACGVAFVAPASGRVLVRNTAEMFNSAASLNLCSIEVRTGGSIGSGSVVLAASDDTALIWSADIRAGASKSVSGLTPGSTYNVRQMFRVQANTGTFSRKELVVEPTVM